MAEARKRVLIIAYYWPPSGGSGVQRWLKFAKYLRDFGWEPIVYTVENGEYPAVDESLLDDVPEGMEVIRSKIWEPFTLYKKFVGRKKDDKMKPGFIIEDGKMGWKEKFSRWVRGNFFIPDARKFWIKPSVKRLTKRLKEKPVDVIISTSTPQSCHMIGLGLKRKTGLPWLADFRDPWTTIYFFDDLGLSKSSVRKHKKMEANVLTEADAVTVVGPHMQQDLGGLVKRDIQVITNGYDSSDLDNLDVSYPQEFSLSYIGMFMDTQNHDALWSGIKKLREQDEEFKKDFKLRFIGNVDQTIVSSIHKFGIEDCLERKNYIPHSEVPFFLASSAVLLLSINKGANAKGILTGKLFEYLAAKRPILCMGPNDGDAGKVINDTKAGIVIEWEDEATVMETLKKWHQSWKNGDLKADSTGIEKYSRRELTRALAEILNSISR